MEMSRTALGVLAGLCLAGGAGGAMFISRSGAPVEASDVAVATAPPSSGAENAEGNVAAAPLVPAAAPLEAPAVRATPSRSVVRTPSRTPAPEQPPAREISNAPLVTEVPAPPLAESPRAPELIVSSPAEPAPVFEELVVSADSVIGLQVDTSVTSETAQIEDEVMAHVTRDIRVGERIAIPAGAKAYGVVTSVGRGGRLRDRARLGVRFHTVVLSDGTRVRMDTDPVFREGDSPTGESAAKIGGGAIGGAIIGGILGGGKGAAIGGSIGAGAGTAAVMAGGRNAATLPAGSTITVRLLEPVSVVLEK